LRGLVADCIVRTAPEEAGCRRQRYVENLGVIQAMGPKGINVTLRHLLCAERHFLGEGRDGLVGGIEPGGPIVGNERLDLLGGEES